MTNAQSPVLCATDLGESGRHAADHAAALAALTGRTVRLLHVADLSADVLPASVPAAIAPALAAMQSRLAERRGEIQARLAAERDRLAAVAPCEAETLEGRPWETILDRGDALAAWLVVVGTGPSPGRAGVPWLGSTADRVVRHSEGAVLVVPSKAGPPAPAGRWLVATDFSPASRAALEFARELAASTGGSLALVHVAAIPEENPEDPHAHAVRAHVVSALGARLRELAGDDATPVHASTGDPAPAIVALAAELGACGIVVGTRGHTAVARLLLGSVAERVLHRARVPVLCVPAS